MTLPPMASPAAVAVAGVVERAVDPHGAAEAGVVPVPEADAVAWGDTSRSARGAIGGWLPLDHRYKINGEWVGTLRDHHA
jgi:hypothetical protein